MRKNRALIKAYYRFKPFLPRSVQLAFRRALACAKRRVHAGWPIDPHSTRRPESWGGWPEEKKFALLLTHDVDTQRGHDRSLALMEMEREMGFVSSFNFVAEGYQVSAGLRSKLVESGFEVGVHGVKHSAELYESREMFDRHAARINRYLDEWQSVGFRSPCMYHNLEWIHALNISYDASTFDFDPFEPQPDGAGTIFPFMVEGSRGHRYVELPYTLPQDFTLFVLFRENDIGTWKKKLNWVAEHGGMALVNVHPDYMNFGEAKRTCEEYPARFYSDLLDFVKKEHGGSYWHVLPRDMAEFWRGRYRPKPEKRASWPARFDEMRKIGAYA